MQIYPDGSLPLFREAGTLRSTVRSLRLLLAAVLFMIPLAASPAPDAWAALQAGNADAVIHNTLTERYHRAVRDAEELRESKIDTQLTLITKSNMHLQWKI